MSEARRRTCPPTRVYEPQIRALPKQAYRAADTAVSYERGASAHVPALASPAMRPEDSVMTPNGTMTKVCTLHPEPCTLHPEPCTYTLHPEP